MCSKPFEHSARNAKYCSEDCQNRARKRNHSRGRRRREYRKDIDTRRAQSMSRKQAREFCVAEETIGVCTRCGQAFYIKDLEDHHRDGDPFNNVKDNLTLQCKKCHPKSDTEWRKEKEADTPITDVRKWAQVGVIVQGEDGTLHTVLLAPDNFRS